MKKVATQQNLSFYEDVKSILQLARDNAYKSVNFIMVEAYWNIGKKIVQEEQNGNDRAEYGTYLIKELSAQLTAEFGKGFSVQSLWNMRQFYNTFPILSTLWRELSWSHYRLIMKVENPTIGIIWCTYKDETVVKYSHINDRDNLFVSKYQMVLPTEEELIQEVERDILEVWI